ncbi:MAG: hypothetical protein ACYSP9_08825 [Planctomycetota bacterium]
MKIQCPYCHQVLPSNGINVQTDIGFCARCNEGFKVSESIDVDEANEAVFNKRPGGTWFEEGIHEFSVGASTRSPIAFFLVPFMCVWSGFSLGGIYGAQIASGKFNLTLSLFGIPFILGSIMFWGFALMAVCGKVVVRVRHRVGSIFVGVGAIGWRRAFDWAEVRVIREEGANVHYPGGYGKGIVFEGKSRLRFGTNLNERRRYFMLQALKYLKTKYS